MKENIAIGLDKWFLYVCVMFYSVYENKQNVIIIVFFKTIMQKNWKFKYQDISR